MNVYFNHISLCKKPERNSTTTTILDNVTGVVPNGKLTCILGPSGCGKTSLLNVLALRIKPTYGYVKLQSDDVSTDSYNRKQIAYVIQDDILLPNIRLHEYLYIYCKLNGFPSQHIKSIMEYYLESFNLEICKDTYTQALSGGQKKRLSIALELLRNPSVIYLDEPTSGLDSPSAIQCIRIIKKLARRGKTVCCSIHQPSSAILSYFDQIIVISSGQIIFSGTLSTILHYLKSIRLSVPKYYNPADFFLELTYGEHYDIPYLVQLWNGYNNIGGIEKDSIFEEHFSIEPNSVHTNRHNILLSTTKSALFFEDYDQPKNSISNIARMGILSKREFQSMYRDWVLLTTKVFSNIFIAVLICLIYYNIGDDGSKVFDNTGCLFFSMIFIMFIGLMPTVLTFPLEKICVIREHKNYWYSLGSYYWSKTVAEIPFNIINPIIFTSIVYFSSGQPRQWTRYSKFTFTLIELSQISQSLGLFIGTLAPSSSVAVFVAPIVGIPLLLFCGYFINVNSINKYIKWISHIAFGKYGWENILLSIYGDNRTFLTCGPSLNKTVTNSTNSLNSPLGSSFNNIACPFKNGADVLNFFSLNETVHNIYQPRFWFNAMILLQFIFVIRIVTFICLKLVVRFTVI